MVGKYVFIEPFYGGSHRQLVDLLVKEFGGSLFTLPASKWHWRMRVSALHFAMTIPQSVAYRVLFASSVLNLCELVSLRPDLATLHKVLYFHENQLVYPVRKQQDRDFQYGYNEILSCLVADVVLFNSHFNMTSFLTSIDTYLKLMPDFRPKLLADKIQSKCRVIYFPLELPQSLKNESDGDKKQEISMPPEASSVNDMSRMYLQSNHQRVEIECGMESENKHSGTLEATASNPGSIESSSDHRPLHIVWPHRWEHDKGPEEFCSVLLKLIDAKADFHVSILGMHTKDIPSIFSSTFPLLGDRLLHHEYMEKEEYWKVLQQADVVVSTAKHEFFGIAMLEAVICGCYPLCPNQLVYPEIYPNECLYNTEQQLFKRLNSFCKYPHLVRRTQHVLDISKYTWDNLRSDYHQVLMG